MYVVETNFEKMAAGLCTFSPGYLFSTSRQEAPKCCTNSQHDPCLTVHVGDLVDVVSVFTVGLDPHGQEVVLDGVEGEAVAPVRRRSKQLVLSGWRGERLHRRPAHAGHCVSGVRVEVGQRVSAEHDRLLGRHRAPRQLLQGQVPLLRRGAGPHGGSLRGGGRGDGRAEGRGGGGRARRANGELAGAEGGERPAMRRGIRESVEPAKLSLRVKLSDFNSMLVTVFCPRPRFEIGLGVRQQKGRALSELVAQMSEEGSLVRKFAFPSAISIYVD